MVADPKRFYEALADGKIDYTNPWKSGAREYDETVLTGTDLARMAVGSTPMRVAQQRDVTGIKNAETEKLERKTKRYKSQLITAYRRYGFDAKYRDDLERVIGNLARRAADDGVHLTARQVNRWVRDAFTPRLQRTVRQARRQLRPEIFDLAKPILDDVLRENAGP